MLMRRQGAMEIQQLTTVLLRHVTREGEHYDWMLSDPQVSGDEGELLTFRVELPSEKWGKTGYFEMTKLANHRRAYLEYEGEISGGRGTVHRIDNGWYIAREWGENGGFIELSMRKFTGEIELRRIDGSQWYIKVLKTVADNGNIR